MAKTAVAMSGGVDSSVAAMILARAGHRVVGLSLRLGNGPDGAWRAGAKAAAELGLEHHVVDAAPEFERLVLGPSVRQYARGRTPNPCALCNAGVKFPLLWRAARRLGCEVLATGHYARLERDSQGPILAQGLDVSKSQAYFLARLEPSLLSRLCFPLGELSKKQVKEMAAQAGLRAAGLAESQDNCFLPPGGWDELMARYDAIRPGAVEDAQGRVLAAHQGLHRFTIGQRRGLGVAAGRPLYVLELDGARAAVKVGPSSGLMVKGLRARDPHWFRDPVPGREMTVRHRYTRREARCLVHIRDDMLEVELNEPERAVAPGQLAVFFQGRRVMGSAWITDVIH